MPYQSSPVAYFAAIMDMIGGPREFRRNNVFREDFKLFPDQQYRYAFTDDTVLTMAIARTLREAREKNDEDFVRNAVLNIKSFAKQYPNGIFPGGYGTNFGRWVVTPGSDVIKSKQPSYGNGSAMRVSAVGWAYNSLEKTNQVARLTAITSHAHEEGIKGAQAIASAVYLARAGVSKEDIKSYIEGKFGYDLDQKLEDIRNYHENVLREQSEFCQTTVPMALCAFLNGDSFEDCGRKAVSIGGDSDTIGAMTGSIAGAFYGMPKWLEKECDRRMNLQMRREAKAFQAHLNSVDTEPNMEEIEIALASARVEQHALRQYREKSQTQPKNDPKYIELLAERESVRLFYEEVNKARENTDYQTAGTLLEMKADVLAKLKAYVQESADFKKKCAKMDKWPGKTDRIPDCDWTRRKDYKETQPQRLVDKVSLNQKLIPVNMVKNTKDFQKVMTSITDQATKDSQKMKELFSEVFHRAGEKLAENQSEAFYQDAIDKLAAENGENELLKDVLEDLQTMKKEAELAKNPGQVGVDAEDKKDATSKLGMFDPLKLGEKTLQKMEKLSEQLKQKAIKLDAISEEYKTLVKQLASIEKLSNAVGAWCQAHEKVVVAENEKVNALPVPKDMDDLKRRYEERELQYSELTVDGRKTYRFYLASAVDSILGPETEALFRDDDQLEMLERASRLLAEKNTNAATDTLQKLFDEINGKLMDTDEPKADAPQKEKDAYDLMQKQVSHLTHLMSMVDDVVTAPADGRIRAEASQAKWERNAMRNEEITELSAASERYDKFANMNRLLVVQEEAVKETMLGIKNKYANTNEPEKYLELEEYDLADRAQGAYRKIRELLTDIAVSGKEKKLSHLSEETRTELATIVLHQTLRANIVSAAVLHTDSQMLQELEEQGVARMINDMKNTDVFKRFEKSMTVDKLEEALKNSTSMMNAYANFTTMDALRREDDLYAQNQARNKQIAEEEAQKNQVENVKTAEKAQMNQPENVKAPAENVAQNVATNAASGEYGDESFDNSFAEDLLS